MGPLKTTLAIVGLVVVAGVGAPAHSQTDPSKTGTGPRGTAVGPSTEPSPNSNGTGNASSGANSGKASVSNKSNRPAQGDSR